MKNNGALVISLDFELIWGVFDTVSIDHKLEYFLNTRTVIPRMLDLFVQENIHATWASVGMLFNKNWQEWRHNKPSNLPNYKNSNLSSYKFGETIELTKYNKLCFAPELIKMINQSKGQEIATHTYSHYYCLEKTQEVKDFGDDLEKAISVSSDMGIELKSLVFPRNQIRKDYLKICYDLGIENVRSNPKSWYWDDTSKSGLSSKIARTADAYINLGKKSYPISELVALENLPLEQKASRFLRPVEGNAILRKLKLDRIKSEMTIAAKSDEVYHLWWHPHNFGEKPVESLIDLSNIIKHYKFLEDKYEFRSLNMLELARTII